MKRFFPIAILVLGITALVVSKNLMRPEATGEALVSISVPILQDADLGGQALFEENCASCHGKYAVGKQGFAPPLVHKIYKPSHHPDIAFELAAKNGVRSHHWSFGDMPPVSDINEKDIAAIVSYIRKLQVANGID